MLHHLDLDARRLETRATELIRRVGLEDDYGQQGGLIAHYDIDEHQFVIEDEAVRTKWSVPDDHFLTQNDWDQMRCFILSCTEHGCPEEHEHYKEED